VRQTLLIVEDSDFSRDLLVQLFEDSYDIALASDGGAAVELARTAHPDLILMDIGLPGIGGLDAVREIRARSSDVPIIAVSSHVMPGDEESALEAGCDDFMRKPIDDVALIELVARHLERR
jgi:two-component system, cell cycle response regulator DivK